MFAGFYGLGWALWGGLGVAAACYGALAFPVERAAGGLDLLFTTALADGEIVGDRLRGFFRVYGPVMLSFGPVWWLFGMAAPWREAGTVAAVALAPLLILAELGAVATWGMWVSRWTASPVRAVVVTLTAASAWQLAKAFVVFGTVDYRPLVAEAMFFLPDVVIGTVCLAHLTARLRATTRFG